MAKKLLQVLAGDPVWPPPVWLMRQAGRYLPEYRHLRAQAGSFMALCTNPARAAEITLQPLRRFSLDAAILFSDILILPWALGQDLQFREGEGPILPPLQTGAALAALDRTLVADRVAPVLETVRRVQRDLPDTAALIGFAGSPWTVACYMVEGGGSRDHAGVRGLLYRDPELFSALMDLLTRATIDYLLLQAEAGAEVLMLFDSWAGVLPPLSFRQHVIAPTRQIVRALKARFPHLPVIGFPRLAGLLIGPYAAETGVDAVGMDTGTDPTLARAAVPPSVALQGNLDPQVLVAGGKALRDHATSIAMAMRGRPHIFNLGHGIVPQTPPEHVAALLALVETLGQADIYPADRQAGVAIGRQS